MLELASPLRARGEPSAPEAGRAAAALLAEAIRIATVMPPGNERAVAELLAEALQRPGIEVELIPTPARLGEPADTASGRAALYARLRGRGEARPLILLSHLDVVPADEGQWVHPPFAGTIADGHVHGRGALDAKGVAVIQLFTLLELARRDVPLSRDVILLATPDEEHGGKLGARHLLRQHGALLADAEFLLTEGGSIRPGHAELDMSPARPPIWGVAITEKSPCWLRLSAEGEAGHGSTPKRDGAVDRLIAALDRVRRVETPIRILAEVEAMFLALAPSAPAADRAGLIALATALEGDSGFRRRFLADPGNAALVRDTISINVLAAGSRTNVIPGDAHAEIDARLLPGERCEDFARDLEAVISDSKIELEIFLSFSSRSSPADTDLFRAIERAASRIEPGALVVPRMIAGFTDAHWFREQGIIAYGFVPRWLPPREAATIHGVDERVSIDNLSRGISTLVEIIEELAP